MFKARSKQAWPLKGKVWLSEQIQNGSIWLKNEKSMQRGMHNWYQGPQPTPSNLLKLEQKKSSIALIFINMFIVLQISNSI